MPCVCWHLRAHNMRPYGMAAACRMDLWAPPFRRGRRPRRPGEKTRTARWGYRPYGICAWEQRELGKVPEKPGDKQVELWILS